MDPTLYESDFLEWASTNARALREHRLADVDTERLAEELEDMGRSHINSFRSHLRNLMLHLLKWKYQKTHRSPSWQRTIAAARIAIHDLLRDSPGLQSKREQLIAEAYPGAAKLAALETGLSKVFPPECPWDFAHLLDEDFLPE